MILLPRIDALERLPTSLDLQFVVPASTPYFEGHFRDIGLLPGVVQVGWAIELARVHIPYSGRFRGLSAVKFMRVIKPDSAVTLRLAVDVQRRELSFDYRLAGEPCSSGCVLFH